MGSREFEWSLEIIWRGRNKKTSQKTVVIVSRQSRLVGLVEFLRVGSCSLRKLQQTPERNIPWKTQKSPPILWFGNPCILGYLGYVLSGSVGFFEILTNQDSMVVFFSRLTWQQEKQTWTKMWVFPMKNTGFLCPACRRLVYWKVNQKTLEEPKQPIVDTAITYRSPKPVYLQSVVLFLHVFILGSSWES